MRPMTLLAATALFLATPVLAAQPILGRWLTEDRSAIVQVAPCGAALCGRIVRVLKSAPGSAATDVNNPDATLRARPVLGLPILTGFAERGDDWRGRIYDPRNGKTYKSIVARQADGNLKVQGCIAFFCQTQVWARAN